MGTIKEGYTLSVIDPESNILGDIKLGGYNLDIKVARSYLVDEIKDTLPQEAFEDNPEGDTKEVGMNQLTLITEEREYKPGYGNPGEPQGSNFHTLMLHAVAEMYGPGGIVVDEAKAKATSCECVEYKPAKYIAVDNAFNRANYPEEIGKVYDSPPSYVAVEKIEGKYWCTSKGVVGALTDEQEKIYCNPMVMVERPGVKERMVKWSEAVETCRAQLPPTDGRTRLEIYLDCMSRELTKAGVEA